MITQGKEKRNGGKVKVALRIIVKQTSENQFQAVCLELSLVSLGNTVDECIGRMKEAIHAYLDIILENPKEKYIITPVRFYWVHRLLFNFLSICWRWHQRSRNQWAFPKMRPVLEECMAPNGIF